MIRAIVVLVAILPLLAACEPSGRGTADEMRMRSQFHLYDFEQNFGYAQAV